MHENIRLFDDAIRTAGSKTMLYMTWSRQHEPQNQQLIIDAYTEIGAERGAVVVPVGVAWKRFLDTHSSPNLYDKDGSHPSLAGSYLAACVFFSVLYNESPVGIDSDLKGLNERDVALVQGKAWHDVSEQTEAATTSK